jgi:hypothetical protein
MSPAELIRELAGRDSELKQTGQQIMTDTDVTDLKMQIR